MNKMDAVEQGPADFFCKAPDSKHFWLRRLCVSVTAVELGRRVCVCVCVCGVNTQECVWLYSSEVLIMVSEKKTE